MPCPARVSTPGGGSWTGAHGSGARYRSPGPEPDTHSSSPRAAPSGTGRPAAAVTELRCAAKTQESVRDLCGDRGTILAVTGEDLDAAEIARLLEDCELTDAEMAGGFDGLADPFGLTPTL